MLTLTYEDFYRAGIIESGHFILNSKRHTEQFIVKERILKYADDNVDEDGERRRQGRILIWSIRDKLARFAEHCKSDMIVGPETGGAKLAKLVAEELGIPWAGLPKSNDGGRFVLPEETRDLIVGKRLALVDDILTTGGTLKRAKETLQDAGGEVACILTIIRRGFTPINFCDGIVYASLASFAITDYDADDCPPCDRLIPITPKPRS